MADSIRRRYRTRGLAAAQRELLLFLRNAIGSIVSWEFLAVVAPLLALWEAAPRLGWVPATLVPPPTQVAQAAWGMATDIGLLGHAAASVGRFAFGLLLAVALALPIGVLMGWNLFVRKHALPLFQILAPIPPPAWVPITIVAFGIGLPMQVFLIFLGAFYPVLFNTYQGIKDADPRFIASARSLGASEWTLIRRILVWHALGHIVMGIKIGIAMALVMVVIAEMHGGRTGLGYLLVEAKEYFQIDRMIVCMLLLGALGWLGIEVMKHIELRVALWKGGR